MKTKNLKFKIILCAFVALWLCASAFGFVADVDDDNDVDQFDLRIFCEYWLESPVADPNCDFVVDGIVNFLDFAILAAEWQGHLEIYVPPIPNVAPSANDVSVSVVAYIPQTITLLATDDGLPNPPARLKYLIIDLPNDVNHYLQDTASGGQVKIRPQDLLYRLSTWGNDVIFATSTTGSTNFKYKVYDGNLYSAEKTVSITVAANPKDCLSFDGSGSVSIPDTGNYFDLDPNRGIALFVQTRQLYCKLLDKYEPGAEGYELYLINGRPQVYLYDSNGLVASLKHNVRVADGHWHQIGFIYDPNGFLMVSECNETNFTAENYGFTSTGWIAVPVRNYSNSSNLIIGSGFRGEIDNPRAHNMILTDRFFGYEGFVCQSRTTAGTLLEFFGITLYPGASARFHCDYNGTTNTATQIYDDVSATHLIGSISDSNHVKYLPFVWQWYDATVLRRNR